MDRYNIRCMDGTLSYSTNSLRCRLYDLIHHNSSPIGTGFRSYCVTVIFLGLFVMQIGGHRIWDRKVMWNHVFYVVGIIIGHTPILRFIAHLIVIIVQRCQSFTLLTETNDSLFLRESLQCYRIPSVQRRELTKHGFLSGTMSPHYNTIP